MVVVSLSAQQLAKMMIAENDMLLSSCTPNAEEQVRKDIAAFYALSQEEQEETMK